MTERANVCARLGVPIVTFSLGHPSVRMDSCVEEGDILSGPFCILRIFVS